MTSRTDSFKAENIIDTLLSQWRQRQILKRCPIKPNMNIIEFGSGEERFLSYLAKKNCQVTGIDLTAGKYTVQADLNTALPFEDHQFDRVFSLANIEHLTQPKTNLSEALRILKPGGMLYLTTPSLRAKPLLEFLAYKLHIISEVEIRDHKFYYTKKTLENDLLETGAGEVEVGSFQLGLNLWAKAKKTNRN